MGERTIRETAAPGETHSPPLTAKQFVATPEFEQLKYGMRLLLSVSKAKLDRLVEDARADSPRMGNPNAPGRKPLKRHCT
jgi:hypothetical protein